MARRTKYLPILAILGTVATLHADPAPVVPPPAPAPVADTHQEKPLTPAEMNLRAANYSTAANESMRSVLAMKSIAAKQKDVIKVNCVNDKLVQLKAQLNIQEQTSQDLQVSLSKNSDDRIGIFAKLSSENDAIHQLGEDAKACIGTPELFKQDSGTIVDRPEIPDSPDFIPPFDRGNVEPPSYASPYN